MQVQLYTNVSDSRTAGKTLHHIDTVSCRPYGEIDIVNPVLIVKYDAALTQCNYVIIPEYHNRRYFCKVTLQEGGKALLSCTCDVLETAVQFIQDRNYTAIRNEYAPISMVEDNKRVYTSESTIEIFRFNNNFDSDLIGSAGFDCYALSLIG